MQYKRQGFFWTDRQTDLQRLITDDPLPKEYKYKYFFGQFYWRIIFVRFLSLEARNAASLRKERFKSRTLKPADEISISAVKSCFRAKIQLISVLIDRPDSFTNENARIRANE